MIKTPQTLAASKAKRKRSAKRGKGKDQNKRHSPDDNHNNSSPSPSSSAAYDKVARATLTIRSQIFSRQQVRRNELLRTDARTVNTDIAPEDIHSTMPSKFATPAPKAPTPADLINLVSSSESEFTSRSVSRTPDAGIATPIPHANPVIFSMPLQFSPSRSDHAEGNLSGSASDDKMSDAKPHSKFPFWSLNDLEEVTGKIARVQELIAHFMLIGCKNSPSRSDRMFDHSSRGLTHVQRTRRLLHDQCRIMLQGLRQSLNYLFDV